MLDKKLRGGLTYKGAVSTFEYLLNERVGEGTAKIFDGNVDLTLQFIKIASKKFGRCWSSGVMSFEETISEEMAKEIIVEHKRKTFCGMNEDQYNASYILHIDKNRTEIHYVFARVELSTGKAFNPYYVRRDFKKKDLFQDYINTKFNLSSPKQSQSRELVTKNKKKWASKKSTIQKEIDEAVSNLVNTGAIQSRDDIIDFLRENDFEINRLRKGSISVKHDTIRKKDGSLDPISLKGAIYGEIFTDWGSLEESITQEDKRAGRPLEEIRGELDSIIRSQAIFNRERFRARKRTESKADTLTQSTPVSDGIGLRVQESGWENESCIDEHEKEPTTKIEKELDYDIVRANTERRRAESRRSREEFEERKRRTLERSRTSSEDTRPRTLERFAIARSGILEQFESDCRKFKIDFERERNRKQSIVNKFIRLGEQISKLYLKIGGIAKKIKLGVERFVFPESQTIKPKTVKNELEESFFKKIK